MKFIFGKNPVFEFIKSNSDKIFRVLVTNERRFESIDNIVSLAKRNNIKIEYTNKNKLDSITNRAVHQGVLAYIKSETSYTLEDLLDIIKEKQKNAFLVILDEIFDPYNLGAIIRTAEVAGADGVIIPKHRQCKITPTVVKASVGATSYMPVVEVVNIVNCIMSLKEKGIFVIGSDIDSKEEYFNVDMNRDIAIVVGNEGSGIRRLVKEKCSMLVKIPIIGNIPSLNVSVTAGILLYEVVRQKRISNS